MKKIFVTVLASALACVALAQGKKAPATTFDPYDTTTSATLTFKEAVRVALINNVTLNQQKNTLYQTQVNKTYRIAQMGPTVSANGSVYRQDGNTFIQQQGEVVNAVVDVVQGQLQVQMPIFNGLALNNNMRAAVNAQDAQLNQVKRSTQDVINLVATQYLQALLDQELVKIGQENVAVQRKQYDQVKAQVELGARSPVDEFNQKALLNNAEVRLVQAEYTLVTDKITLFQTLLIDPVKNTLLDEPEWDVNAIALDNLSLPELLAVAQENRADLRQAQHTEKASKFGMAAAKGNYYPGLNAFYNLGSAYNQLTTARRDSSYRDFSNQFLTDNRYQVFGLSVNIPIFSGFQNRNTYINQKTVYENNKLNRTNREVLIRGDVLRAYENFQSVQKGYTAAVGGLEASQMAYNLEQERYNLGVTSFVDFANANRTYLQAQVDLAQAKYRFLFQKVLLDYATGTLKVEDLP